MAVHVDPAQTFGACFKGRYSEGYLCSCSQYFLVDWRLDFNIFYSIYFLQYFSWIYILQIWDTVPKPHAHKNTPLSEFFNVITLSDWLDIHFAFLVIDLISWFIFLTEGWDHCFIQLWREGGEVQRGGNVFNIRGSSWSFVSFILSGFFCYISIWTCSYVYTCRYR